MRQSTARGARADVRRARGRSEHACALQLRRQVFCEEQGVPEAEEVDGRDADSMHLVAVRGGEVLGTCRLLFAAGTVQFSRLAVRADVRRAGIARALLREAEREARAQGAWGLVLHAQTYARALYEQAGYEQRGEPFIEAGIEHVAMEKPLA